MDNKEENPGEEKKPFKIKLPFEGPVKMPFPIPEAMKNHPFLQGKMKFIAIGVVVIALIFGANMMKGLF